MTANPKPLYPCVHWDPERAEMQSNPNTAEFAVSNGLELQRRMGGILLEECEILMRDRLHFGRQSAEALPEAFRG